MILPTSSRTPIVGESSTRFRSGSRKYTDIIDPLAPVSFHRASDEAHAGMIEVGNDLKPAQR